MNLKVMRKQQHIILFISQNDNYFIENTPSFYRMYKNLLYFHNHPDYEVLVIQPRRDKSQENLKLKKEITTYYFRELKLFNNTFLHLTDINPFFITKVIRILKIHKLDLIHVDYPYGIIVLSMLSKIPISYNSYNVEALYWKKIVSQYTKIPFFFRKTYAKFIYFLERSAIRRCVNINAISNHDLMQFKKLYQLYSEKFILNGMGLKTEIYDNPVDKKTARELLNLPLNKFIVLFHGDYYTNIPNREAIKNIRFLIAPKIKDNDILFIIAGRIPNYKEEKNIRYLGFVENINQLLYSADIAVVPTFIGSGIKIKIIDYISARIPTILTHQSAKGFSLKNDEHCVIVNSKNPFQEIIEKIQCLKTNPQKILDFKLNLEKLLSDSYKWSKILEKLESRYKKILNPI